MKARFSFFIMLYFVGISSLFSTNYYVSNSGDDTKDGKSPANAWKTLAKVQSAPLIAGDTVFLKGGNAFYESLTISSKNGTEAQPIVFTSYGEGKAIITGSRPVSGWVSEGGNIWSLSVASEPFQLFKNDEPLTTARIPEIKDKYAGEENFYHITSVINSNYTFISESLIGAPDITGATLHVGTWEWLLKTAVISAFDPSTGRVTVATDIFDVFQKGNRFFINNHKNLLNSEGDWFYDSSLKKLYLYSVVAPSYIVVADKDGNGFTVNGGSNIEISNLAIEHFNGIGIYSTGTLNLKVLDCKVNYNYGKGIYTKDGSRAIIRGSEVSGTTQVGIHNYNPGSIVADCYLHNIGLADIFNKYGFTTGYAVCSYGLNDTLIFNTLEDIGYNGLELKKGTVVKNNLVKYVNLTTIDGGAIYSYQGNGGLIENNIVIGHPNIGILRSHGIYMDNYTHDVVIRNNTVAGFNYNLYVNKGAYNISFYNNKAFDAQKTGLWIYSASNIVVKNNVLFNVDPKVSPFTFQSISNWNTIKSDSNYIYNAGGYVAANIYGTGCIQLSEWSKLSNQDKNSGTNNRILNIYPVVKSSSGAKVLESTFEDGKDGWVNWASVSQIVQRDDNPLSKCLYDTLASGRTTGNINVAGIKIEKGKDYVLEFDMKTHKTSLSHINLISESGVKYLDKYNFWMKPGWNHYQIQIKNAEVSSVNANLAFYCGYSSYSYSTPNAFYIDNVTITECELDENVENFTLLYNDSRVEKTFSLQSSWATLKSEPVSSTVVLKPFESVILLRPEVLTATLNLSKGWNIISFKNIPVEKDIELIFKEAISYGKLLKIQDEKGNVCEYSGTPQGWINRIGMVNPNRAYKVNMLESFDLNYEGYNLIPMDVPLIEGWNLFPYHKSVEENTTTYFQSLITEGSLLEVRDSKGNTLLKLPDGQWQNSIGNLSPGKGYEIKVSKNTTFVVPDK